MKRFFKISCLILALVIVISAGIVTTIAAETSEKSEVSAVSQIIVHVRLENKTQPYLYLWNSLPTNSAMSKSYPGEKMTSSGEWYNYTVSNVTKVNALVTDSTGKQYSREQKLTTKEGESTEWWFDKTRWTKYDPDRPDPVESVDLRSESIYFVMTTRFYDGDKSNNVHCWDDGKANNPDSDPAWRGDFKGLAEKLDYIKALGFSAIWITPIVENGSGYDYHGYHAMNFGAVDKRYESDDFTFEDLIRADKGIFKARVHELLTHQIDHADRGKAHVDHRPTAARSSRGRIIGGSDDVGVFVEEGIDLLAAEAVIAECDEVDARGEQMLGGSRGNPVAVGGILTVADHKIDLLLLLEARQTPAQEFASYRADNVADTHNAHSIIFLYLR